jgi:hypothetical protein
MAREAGSMSPSGQTCPHRKTCQMMVQWTRRQFLSPQRFDQFHAMRFKVKAGQSAEKRATLKVTGTGSNQKQKNTNQTTHEGGSKELDGN